jgi:proteasome lid subunit RPN8/RPN11
MGLRLGEGITRALEAYARQSAPNECCGFLAGQGNHVLTLYPLTNVAGRPTTEYLADALDVFAAFKAMRAKDERLLGIYHSHPSSEASPSEVDIERAYYSDAAYFIISLQPRLELRAYRIVSGQVEEIAYTISDGE